MYFDEKTKGIGNKHEDKFDTSEEEYDLQKAKWIGMKIFECVKGEVELAIVCWLDGAPL